MDSEKQVVDINDFIANNIVVDRFPVANEIGGKHSDCHVVINVSDEFYLGNAEHVMKHKKQNYYFPMGEKGKDIGIVSIYGAMNVLYQIYTFKPHWKVLLHCQAGLNRSPTIKAAFHYMMTTEHMKGDNRLLLNCEKQHLPELKQTELFLTKCKEAFDNSHKFIGGMLDWVIKESKL